MTNPVDNDTREHIAAHQWKGFPNSLTEPANSICRLALKWYTGYPVGYRRMGAANPLRSRQWCHTAGRHATPDCPSQLALPIRYICEHTPIILGPFYPPSSARVTVYGSNSRLSSSFPSISIYIHVIMLWFSLVACCLDYKKGAAARKTALNFYIYLFTDIPRHIFMHSTSQSKKYWLLLPRLPRILAKVIYYFNYLLPFYL
jgi:hypothetical protein